MVDWLGWVNLALGLTGTWGILILLRQWFIDTKSSNPYKTRFPWNLQEAGPRRVGLEVIIKNRRSTAAEFWWILGDPSGRLNGPHGTTGYVNGLVRKSPSLRFTESDTIQVESHGTGKFFLTAEVPKFLGWPKTARFSLTDSSGWSGEIELKMPVKPTPGSSAALEPLGATLITYPHD
jgi:hypothetical protein